MLWSIANRKRESHTKLTAKSTDARLGFLPVGDAMEAWTIEVSAWVSRASESRERRRCRAARTLLEEGAGRPLGAAGCWRPFDAKTKDGE